MASWMMHFRVADVLLRDGGWPHLPHSVQAAFVLGNIAPDSGVPAPDGQGYLPNKTVSHFMRRFEGVPAGENPERCDPALLVRDWLAPAVNRKDPPVAAFYFGYLCHLVTDNAWVRDFIYPAKVRFAHLRLVDGVETPEGVARFYSFLKKDWYDMDFLYVKKNPELLSYRLFLAAEDMENRYLPFFPANAFAVKREEIAEFYRRGAERVTERETYISDEEAEAFIKRISREIRHDFGDILSAEPAIAALCPSMTDVCTV